MKSTPHIRVRLLILVTLFSMAMGYLESAVVVYMREILYPAGFQFPLAPIEMDLAITEIIREAATLIMLLTIGLIAGKTPSEKFAWFLYSFAIWDIFYYVGLKLLVDWPASLLTWDILFLIPVTWVGPVITPVIVALTMILLALVLVYFSRTREKASMIAREWAILILGSVILILSWTWDYSGYILEHFSFREIWTIPRGELFQVAQEYIPRRFNWGIYALGELIVLSGIIMIYLRLGNIQHPTKNDDF
jgi:hypothetical protein